MPSRYLRELPAPAQPLGPRPPLTLRKRPRRMVSDPPIRTAVQGDCSMKLIVFQVENPPRIHSGEIREELAKRMTLARDTAHAWLSPARVMEPETGEIARLMGPPFARVMGQSAGRRRPELPGA